MSTSIGGLFIVVILALHPDYQGNSFPLELALCVASGLSGWRPVSAGAAALAIRASMLLALPDAMSTSVSVVVLLTVACASALGRWRAAAIFCLGYVAVSAASVPLEPPAGTFTDVIRTVVGSTFTAALVWLSTFGFHQLRIVLDHRHEQQSTEQRRVIARQLHDTAAQSLGRISVIAEAGRHARDLAPAAADRFERIVNLAQSAGEDLDAMLLALRDGNSELSDAFSETISLEEAAEQAAEALRSEGFTPLTICDNAAATLSPVGRDCLVAVIREFSRNISKHGTAGPCTLRVEVSRPHQVITITTTNQRSSGLRRPRPGGRGITGLRERVTILGGHLTSAPSPSDPTIWLASATIRLEEGSHA